MTLHPDLLAALFSKSPEEIAQMSPEQLAQALNGPQGQGLSGTLGAMLGIRFLSAGRERIVAEMEVAGKLQPAGRLHGGASLALAEELASVGSWLNLDPTRQVAVGVDLNATHVRGTSSGKVTGEATLSYRGRSLMVWNIEIRDERGKVTSLARCTCNVIALGA